MGGLPIDQVEKNGEMLQTLSQTLMIYQEGGKDFQVKASTDIPYLDVKAARGPTGDRWEMTLTLVKS